MYNFGVYVWLSCLVKCLKADKVRDNDEEYFTLDQLISRYL